MKRWNWQPNNFQTISHYLIILMWLLIIQWENSTPHLMIWVSQAQGNHPSEIQYIPQMVQA